MSCRSWWLIPAATYQCHIPKYMMCLHYTLQILNQPLRSSPSSSRSASLRSSPCPSSRCRISSSCGCCSAWLSNLAMISSNLKKTQKTPEVGTGKPRGWDPDRKTPPIPHPAIPTTDPDPKIPKKTRSLPQNQVRKSFTAISRPPQCWAENHLQGRTLSSTNSHQAVTVEALKT